MYSPAFCLQLNFARGLTFVRDHIDALHGLLDLKFVTGEDQRDGLALGQVLIVSLAFIPVCFATLHAHCIALLQRCIVEVVTEGSLTLLIHGVLGHFKAFVFLQLAVAGFDRIDAANFLLLFSF